MGNYQAKCQGTMDENFWNQPKFSEIYHSETSYYKEIKHKHFM